LWDEIRWNEYMASEEAATDLPAELENLSL